MFLTHFGHSTRLEVHNQWHPDSTWLQISDLSVPCWPEDPTPYNLDLKANAAKH